VIKNKRVIVTGAAGQDGLILGHILNQHENEVLGIVVSESQKNFVKSYNPKLQLLVSDSSDVSKIERVIIDFLPDFIFHLGAKSSVSESWGKSRETLEANIFVTLNWLNALKNLKLFDTRFFHASSSEMFGLPESFPQSEKTLLHPRSPYGVSKVAAHHLVINYRESYGQFASTGILFNHESPLRTPNFVTRKITQGVAAISLGKMDRISLGNLDVSRDWGWAPDYVLGMIKILSHKQPDDFVLSSGVSHSLKEFLKQAFVNVGIVDWEKFVKIDKDLFRPADVVALVGDSTKAKNELKWQTQVDFEKLIENMVAFDIKFLTDGSTPIWKSK
jgi:GDPmannose 4,6-dehydratase